VPKSPAAQKLLFKNQKKRILLPAWEIRMPRRSCLCCRRSFGRPPRCAEQGVLNYFCDKIVLSLGNTHVSRRASSRTLIFCLWPMKYGHCETTSRKKLLLAMKNTTFYIFRPTDFKKAPLCACKSTSFTCLSAFFAICASAR
jgi:hypothetical protein